MKQFTKQLLFIIIAGAVIIAGGLVIYSATPSGKIAIKPSKTAKLKVVNQENATTSSNNPVGWWKMDEGTGTTAGDSSGNGNTGTLYGGVQWTTGKLGRGLSFDGSDDYVSVADSANLNSTSITVSVWVKSTKNGASWQQGIVAKANFSGFENGWILRKYTNDEFEFGTGSSYPRLDHLTYSNLAYTDNNWHHIVGVSIAGVANYIYVDGVRQTASRAGAGVAIVTTTQPVTIGTAYGDMPLYTLYHERFGGSIDDPRIYSRALSATEIAQMYNSTKDGYLGKIKVSTGIILYFKLDEVSWATTTNTTPVKDYSGKGNNGTPFNHASMVAGQISKAGSFDGTDDYIGIAGNVGSTTRALSFWAKPNSTTQKLIELSASDYVSLSSGVVSVAGFGTPTIYVDGNATTSFANTNWHFITILSSVNMVANGVNLGKNGATYYNGLLDDIKLYNRTLTATEIEQSHQRGLMGKEQ